MSIGDRSTVNLGEGAQKRSKESEEHRWTINMVYSVREHGRRREEPASWAALSHPCQPCLSDQRCEVICQPLLLKENTGSPNM